MDASKTLNAFTALCVAICAAALVTMAWNSQKEAPANIGRYQFIVQGGGTWRLDTATGQIQVATMKDGQRLIAIFNENP